MFGYFILKLIGGHFSFATEAFTVVAMTFLFLFVLSSAAFNTHISLIMFDHSNKIKIIYDENKILVSIYSISDFSDRRL